MKRQVIAALAACALASADAAGIDRSFLDGLLRIPSVTSDIPRVNEAVGFVRDWLEARGVACEVEKDDAGRMALYASTRPGRMQDYLLVVHLDVVPGAPGQFVPRIENGRVYARGAYDCKGNVAIAAQALADLAGRASLGVVFAGDEETGGLTTKMMAERGCLARKLVIVFDSGTYGAYGAQKGNFYVRARAKGRGGHSSRPWECDNPIERLWAGCARVKAAWPAPTDDRWCNVISTTVVSAGDAPNRIPDYADVWYNLRYIEDRVPERLCDMLVEVGGFEIVERRSSGGPMQTDPNDPEVRKFVAARRAKWPDRDAKLGRMLAMTDARHYTGRGAPVLISGSCGGDEHSANEWNDFANMDENLDMLEAYFLGAE